MSSRQKPQPLGESGDFQTKRGIKTQTVNNNPQPQQEEAIQPKREAVKPPPKEKDLNYRLKLRVYGKGFNASNSHSFCVDDVPAGTSTEIGVLNLVSIEYFEFEF